MCVGSDVQASFFFSSFTGTHWCLFIPVWHGNHLADRFQSAFCINLISLIIRKPDSINQGKEFKKDLDFVAELLRWGETVGGEAQRDQRKDN